MGHYCHYQAMPEASRLFRRLEHERLLCAAYDRLLHQPAGPYDFDFLAPEELEETLSGLAAEQPFGSRAVLDRAVEELRAELKAAKQDATGLDSRAAYMKMDCEFERTLVEQLNHLDHPASGDLANRLLGGIQQLAPSGPGAFSSRLRLVPAEVVAEAAGWLRPMSRGDFKWLADEFQSWQRAYLEAAEHGEAIVVGCG